MDGVFLLSLNYSLRLRGYQESGRALDYMPWWRRIAIDGREGWFIIYTVLLMVGVAQW